MRALLKRTEEWVDIDTKCLFDNQYNTTEECGNKRIFDGDIKRIEGDIRLGLGKCKYCGAIVKRGEEEKHFAEMEAKKLKCSMNEIETDSCFWKSRKYLGETEVSHEERTEIVDGVAKVINVRTMEQKWIPYCSHAEKHGGYTHDEHRKYGIRWFTPENTYFLKYPNGMADYTVKDLLRNGWRQRWEDCYTYYIYNSALGSYTLSIHLKMDEKTIDFFTLENARNRFCFTYDPNEDVYILRDGINNSPRTVDKLLEEGTTSYGRTYPKCNETINKQVKKVVKALYESIAKIEEEQKGA